MITLSAPFNKTEVTICLPNPAFNDGIGIRTNINILKATDNHTYSYVKKKGGKRLDYTFYIALEKAYELQRFIELFLTHFIRLIDHLGRIWRVRLIGDPFTYSFRMRGNRAEVDLTFEGEKCQEA